MYVKSIILKSTSQHQHHQYNQSNHSYKPVLIDGVKNQMALNVSEERLKNENLPSSMLFGDQKEVIHTIIKDKEKSDLSCLLKKKNNGENNSWGGTPSSISLGSDAIKK